ncbi:hypothetical protein K435DRAFT_384683 [Dendrothele bispora CBS 962.96]|uniref:Uncharacterized protein n=1 Tax=Dendrothele bispora (strain CBS 962.96) TaxID=1314807 RepID=A0A4S8LBI0_DENBC|nr:hypothetical protein K435DRAFT_384683 [Dendrothele bispora CBS 962.96]
MLIRLLPDPHQPTVLFKLTFENLPDHLAYPLSWSNQLAALSCDDLEIPELMHVLDKAVGAQSILEEVTFDLVQNRIKCVFIDGEMEEWAFGTGLDQSRGQADSFHVPKEDESLRSDKLDVIRRLESVLADVNESAAEMDREKKREEEREKERLKLQEEEERGRELERQQQEEASTTTVQRSDSVGKKKHKKSKSLLMNLVSSLFPLSLNSPNSPISPRSPSSLPVSRSPSRSPSSSRSPSRAPSLRSIRSENAKSPMGSSSAPSTLSRASSISAVSQVTGGKKSSGWKKPKRRGRGRTLSTSSNALPVPPSSNTGDENAVQHTPEASESSSVSADPLAKNREPSGEEHQQEDSRGLPVVVVVAVPPLPPLTPRGLRRRARSTLVDTFRMYVVPEVTRRIRCGTYFTSSVPMSPSVSTFPTPALTPTRATYPNHQGPTTAALSASSDFPVSSASSSTYNNSPSLSAPIPTIPLYHPNNIGGDSILYYVWVVGSMMKRVEARIGEVIREVREELERLEKGGVSHGL